MKTRFVVMRSNEMEKSGGMGSNGYPKYNSGVMRQ
jgi:hypothetical protein